MVQVSSIQVGERYRVQPSHFHRPFIGKVKNVDGSTIVFEIENFELCDREKIEDSRLIIVNIADVKYSMDSSYFFS